MCVVYAGVALAAPKISAREALKRATEQDRSEEYDKALQTLDQGLATAPKDLKLLQLKGE